MMTKTKFARMNSKVSAFLKDQFSDDPVYQAELAELWSLFCELGLPSHDFVAGFASGKKPSLVQRIWEMILAKHLHGLGHKIVCPNSGPDFRFELNGKTVWVEATSPEPRGLPPDWLDPGICGVHRFPHEQILLRWTTALDSKWKALREYRKKRVVGTNDAYVIAINGCQLSLFPEPCGITQIPFGVETVFPVGPLAHRINRHTGKLGDAFISERFYIANANKTNIPTTSFVDPSYEGVSALIGCTSDRCHGKPLALHVVHNPHATVKLPLGSLGGQDDEWHATPVADQPGEFELQRVTPPKTA